MPKESEFSGRVQNYPRYNLELIDFDERDVLKYSDRYGSFLIVNGKHSLTAQQFENNPNYIVNKNLHFDQSYGPDRENKIRIGKEVTVETSNIPDWQNGTMLGLKQNESPKRLIFKLGTYNVFDVFISEDFGFVQLWGFTPPSIIDKGQDNKIPNAIVFNGRYFTEYPVTKLAQKLVISPSSLVVPHVDGFTELRVGKTVKLLDTDFVISGFVVDETFGGRDSHVVINTKGVSDQLKVDARVLVDKLKSGQKKPQDTVETDEFQTVGEIREWKVTLGSGEGLTLRSQTSYMFTVEGTMQQCILKYFVTRQSGEESDMYVGIQLPTDGGEFIATEVLAQKFAECSMEPLPEPFSGKKV